MLIPGVFFLVLAGELLAGHPAVRTLTVPGGMHVDTAWHFHDSPLVVAESLPVGTVIAVTQIPEQGARFAMTGSTRGALWCRSRYVRSVATARTDLDGVAVRIIPEKQAGFSATGAAREGRVWRQGGIRIELVKTGPLRSGRLTRLQDVVEYRLLEYHQGRTQVMLRESLKLQAALEVRVIPSVAPRPDSRAGGTVT
ncbi:hypothetical protein [Trabulsiella odontotermitis]|uniref:Uncharacterized protein n=1 Tax=Trabulsiella odontotermitis TaxID=379893 RepID=A0A0L0GUX4_9ENTR|nr:hypothetical protein [Trabulsiella odontotermitis]KNC92910.1 hypothetical protein GM31_21510 [Trabulsiella odontotermitis]